MVEGSASILINRPAAEIFAAVADITRMGEWSPECVAARWVPPADGPEVGAKFEGDNVAKIGPITVKKWTTTSVVTALEKERVFEFEAEGYTTWRYELEDRGESTLVTESYRHAPYGGWQGFVYETLGRRSTGMVKGVEQTLGRLKSSLEG